MLKHSIRNLAVFDTQRWVRSLLVRRRMVLGLLVGATLLLGAFIPNLPFSTSVYDLIIEDIPETKHYGEFKEVFGTEEIIRIVVKCDDIFDPANFAKIAELAEAAGAIEGVRRVISLPGIKQMADPTGKWPLASFKSHIAEVELFERNLISKDHTTSAVTLVLANDARHLDIITAVNDLIGQSGPHLSLYQTGMPLVSKALAQFTRRDFLRLPPITFLLITIMLWIIYRRLSYVLIPIACVSMALIWNLGFISISGKSLSLLTMIVPVFLIAVGTAYCMHIVNAHRQNLLRAGSSSSAVIQTMTECSLPTVLAITTTVIGLATLFANHIDAIREFALFACLGMFSLMVILLTGMPVALSFLTPTPSSTPSRAPAPGWTQRLLDNIIRINLNHQKSAYFILGLIVLISLAGLPRLRVETNPLDYFRRDTEVIRDFHDIYKHLSGSFPVNIDLKAPAGDYFEEIDHLNLIEQFAQHLETLPGVDKAVTFTSYLKLVNYASNGFAPEYYRLPQDALELRLLINTYRSMLGWDMLSAFMEGSFARTNILLLTHLFSSRDFLELRRHISAYAAAQLPSELSWEATGFGMVISASSHYLVNGQVKSLSLTLALIFAIMFLLFLSFKVGLVALVPNIFPIIVNLGLMGWLGIELSMGTSLIASIAIGLAVDDTIHYMVAFNREFKKDLDDRRAMRATLNRIGRPIIFTTLTISFGFAVLAFSSFKPTAIFGILMVVTMISALIGDLIILPSLLRHVELVTLWDLLRLKMGREPSLQIPLLHGLSRAEVHSILMAGTIRNIAAGEILFRKGDSSDSMYAVVSGRFEVIDYEGDETSTAGSQKSINSIRAGDILGEMGLLRKAPRSATVIAREDGELLPINWKVLKRIQWLYPPIGIKLFHNLLNILCDRVERLTHCLANESIVDDLTHLCNRKGFCHILEKEVRRAKRREEKLLLHLLKIHPDALAEQPERRNEILSALAARLSARMRGDDTLTRLGSRTLGLLTTCENGAAVPIIRRRLQEVIEKTHRTFPAADGTISLTTLDVALEPQLSGDEILSRSLASVEMPLSLES